MLNKYYLAAAALCVSLMGYASHANMKKVADSQLTVLESINKPGGVKLVIAKDAQGRVFKQRVRPGESLHTLQSAPVNIRKAKANTFYESFEGYVSSYGMNWIPDGWTKINTEAHTPTEEQLAHNINNSWYVYYSSDMFQDMTPDGESEAFIHFGYEGGYGCNSQAQDEWLVTPVITLGNNETLSFLHQGDPFSTYDYDWNTGNFDRSSVFCNMQVMITDNDGASWTEIWDFERDYISGLSDYECDTFPMEYRNFSVSLSDYAGKDVKIAFRYLRVAGNYTGNSMMIDGVTVYHESEGQEDDPDWVLLGTGSMSDGWVIPALTENNDFYNPADYTFEVTIFEKADEPGIFKIKSPYTSDKFPFINLNGNLTQDYDIIIDASNHDFVVVDPQISGFEHNNPGIKATRYAVPYYISNAGKYYYDDGNEIEDIIAYGFASTFDVENGVITIVNPQYGHMLSNGTLDMGYSCSNMEEYPTVITLPEAEKLPEWEVAGKAILVDGFLYTGFFGNPTGYGWEVDLLTKSDEPNVYMLSNPYSCVESPLSTYNSSTDNVMIKIDATDPDLVIITPQLAGFVNQGEKYYIGNWAGYYISYGYNKGQLSQIFEEKYKDEMKNGVITIKEPLFGFDMDEDFGYQWIDQDKNPLIFPAKIYLPWTTETPDEPAVVGITKVGETETDVEYFSITGVKANGVLSPGVYIRVENGRSSKVIVR